MLCVACHRWRTFRDHGSSGGGQAGLDVILADEASCLAGGFCPMRARLTVLRQCNAEFVKAELNAMESAHFQQDNGSL